MTTLFREECVACRRDSPRVTDAEIVELRRDVSAWQLLERDGIAQLERVFHFPNFADALSFTNQVGALAETEGHHPTLLTEWGVSRSPGGPTRSVASIGTTSTWPRRPMCWPLTASTAPHWLSLISHRTRARHLLLRSFCRPSRRAP